MDSWQLPQGFRFSGVACGVRGDNGRKDVALMISDVNASAAGVFTTNRVKAAPVHVCKENLPSDSIRGLVVCSGNANACTGQQGLADARKMIEMAAAAVGAKPTEFLVCSTGVIGRFLPMDVIGQGIEQAGKALGDSTQSLSDAAHAILTTDTHIKVSFRVVEVNGKEVVVAGVAKGAAMIGPNMATMLSFVFTDAQASGSELGPLIAEAADQSFNCVSVEGHTSTNDSLIIMANGASGSGKMLGGAWDTFAKAVHEVCGELAKAIAADAEGASHLVTIQVEGLRDSKDARKVAKTVADSALVKTAIFGADPNWGRVVSAAGYSGVIFEEKDLSLWMGEMLLYKDGTPQDFDAKVASDYLKNNRHVHLRLVFKLGKANCTFQTCDLTYDYVKLNADYTT
ncbi:MAG: bifunctional glutamate N-acetyltransferase/amino-acid acetyltransferase ArgJ [Gemmataceae bacterium]|jgi:glutamate N-acetyltransferase/amino-acid N-acetyltransferase